MSHHACSKTYRIKYSVSCDISSINERHTRIRSHIGNMDETPCSFDMVGSTTVNAKGEKTVRIKTTAHEKSNFTSALIDGRTEETETDGDFQANDNAQRDYSGQYTRACPSKRLDGRRRYVLMDSARLEHSSLCSLQRRQPPRPRPLCCTSDALR